MFSVHKQALQHAIENIDFAHHYIETIFSDLSSIIVLGIPLCRSVRQPLHIDALATAFLVFFFFFFFWWGYTAEFWALAATMKLSVSFRFLDLGQSAGLLGRVISSSQGLC
jgi:hypothetical protein